MSVPNSRSERADSSHSLQSDVEKSESAEQPMEIYSPERVSEFLLSNAVDAHDYAQAVKEVRGMGLDPDAIPHARPE